MRTQGSRSGNPGLKDTTALRLSSAISCRAGEGYDNPMGTQYYAVVSISSAQATLDKAKTIIALAQATRRLLGHSLHAQSSYSQQRWSRERNQN
jgi:hypothetical protein